MQIQQEDQQYFIGFNLWAFVISNLFKIWISHLNSTFQIRVQATDSGSFQSVCVVRVYVDHNLNGPVFPTAQYTAFIPETQAPGSTVLNNITATDADVWVSL